MSDEQWERETLREIALASVKEQRLARRWGIFFKLLLAVYLLVLLLLSPSCNWGGGDTVGRHTAVVSVSGPIFEDGDASAAKVITGLRQAFEAEDVAGVVLDINSPGGSPVQAGRINDEIRRLREKHPEVPVYAVVGDVCASGAYYIAAAADRIFVDKASLVGSIGVVMNSFGFTETMDKLGVERRLYTAGESKGFLDPFSPERPDEVKHVQTLLDQIHAQFISVVKAGRGDRLVDDERIFTGLIWTGEESIRLGLADELGDIGFVAREVVGAEKMMDYTRREGFLARFADRLGASAAQELRASFEGRIW